MFKKIPRSVWILSLVSLFTDVSSEMLYPVMPIYLKTIGFTFLGIGILEGIAEAIAGLSKIYFGRVSDIKGNYPVWISAGYGSSFISKFLLAVSSALPLIFLSRLIDRLGKGIRTAPRDAVLALAASEKNTATIFGFHRALDTIGAALGPCIALIIMYLVPGNYRLLFAIVCIPALLGFLLTLFVKEKKHAVSSAIVRLGLLDILRGKGIASKQFIPSIFPFLLFALVNSSDVFLLLKMKSSGLDDTQVILVYIVYNLIYALLAFPVGMLADKFGKKLIIQLGLFCFAITYSGFVVLNNIEAYYLLFIVYAIYAACMESTSKAYLSGFLKLNEKAGGLGFFAGWQSLALLIASVWTGYLWQYNLYHYAFAISALVALLCLWLLAYRNKTNAASE
jgi:MFS family permease